MGKKYTLVVDCGIPYEEKLGRKKLMKELKKISKKKDVPHCDVTVYLGKKDVTNSVFRQYHKMSKKEWEVK